MKKFLLVSLLFSSYLISAQSSSKKICVGQGKYKLYTDQDFDTSFKVLKFDWYYILNEKKYHEGTCKSDTFSNYLMNLILKGNPKDILRIENIKIIANDGIVRRIAGISIEIGWFK